MQDIHIIKQRIEALSYQVKNIAKSGFDVNEDFKRRAIDENYRYNLAEVIANIIINVRFIDNSITKFQEIIDDYNNQHSTALNYQYFLDNCLIREILGDVVIPSMVIRSLRVTNVLAIDTDYYNCLNGYYNEFNNSKILITAHDICDIVNKFGRNKLSIDLLIEKNVITCIYDSNNFEFCTTHYFYLNYLSNEIFAHVIMKKGVSDSLRTILNAGLCNFNELKNILLLGNLNSICYDAVELLSRENDINDSSNEIKKIWFDYNDHRNMAPNVPDINTSFSSSCDLVSFIYDSPYWIEDPFLYQSSREKYSTLLDIIICTSSYDFNYNTKEYNYQTILNLIKNLSKPYITYTIYGLIQDKYPFLAPYLLVDNETANLGLEVIEKIKINPLVHNIENVNRTSQLKHELQIKNDVWLEMFNFVLDQLDEPLNITDTCQYEHISKILINLANKIFSKISIYGNGDNLQHEYFLEKYTSAINIISSKKFYTSPYVNFTLPQMIFSILPILLNKACTSLEEEYEYIEHGYISLSNGSIYHAIELIKLSNTITENDKFYTEIMECKQRLVSTLFNTIIFFYTTNIIKVKEYRSPDILYRKPDRQVNKVGFELVNWSYLYIEFMHYNLLINFNNQISESIIINESEGGIYEENNKQQYHKIELYLKSLMLAYIDINENLSLFEGIIPDISNKLKEIENLIIKHSLKYSKTNLQNASIDIFEYNYVFQNYNLYYQPLKSLLYKCINLFDEETGISFIREFLTNSSDLGRMLSAINSITNKNIVTLIEHKINSVDINEYIESTNWIPEITQALIDATNSKTHWKTYAKQLFETVNAHYEKVKTTRKIPTNKKTHDLLFEISLALAYKEDNRNEFNEIKLPECPPHEDNNQNINLKKYYSILFDVYHAKVYDTAITELKKLHADNIDVPKFAIELFFACTLQAVTDTILNKSLLAKANNEFNTYIASKHGDLNLIEELNRYDSYIKYYKLYHYIAEVNLENFDIAINKLPDEMKFNSQLAPHVYNFYYKRDLNEIAIDYLEKAQQYLSDNDPTGICILETLINNSYNNHKNQSRIKLSIGLLQLLPVNNIPKVVPEKINNKKQLGMFILSEFIEATKVMLDKIKSIKEVQDENKYNDLLVAILKLRFDIWGWVISDQNRGGSSSSGIDAGSIDFTIMSGSTRLTLAEALIHRGENYAQEHTLRCFKYDANLQCFYIIVYSKSVDFCKAWDNHQNYISAAKFEDSVSLLNKDTNNGFKDLSTEFNHIRNIKVAKTQHNSNVEMYHIMVNLNGN